MAIEECSAINHPWQIKPPIYVLKNGAHRVRLVCARCGGIRYDTRSPNGRGLLSRSYDHSAGYDKFLESTEVRNRRSDAWASLIEAKKEVRLNEAKTDSPRLRSVSRTKKGRGRKLRTPQRPARHTA